LTKAFVNTVLMTFPSVRVLGAAVIFLTSMSGQTSAPHFEVASVKRAEGGGPPGDIPRNMDTSPGHFAMRNVPLRYCLEWAYNLKDFEIVGPDWIQSDERYDIFARAAGPATDDEMRPMLQTLLLERFQMKVHRETREMNAYVLIPGKGPAKVKPAPADEAPSLGPGPNHSTAFHKFPLSRLTFLLTRRMDHPVVDLTGLTGLYDYSLDLSGLSEYSGPKSDEPGTSIFTAIQQDLGLKLEARPKQPIEIFVIDTVNKVPIPN
jgi:uncharacterized protein (TIGR03435 family)